MRNHSIYSFSKTQLSMLWSWLRIVRSLIWIPLISLSLVFPVGCDDDDDDFSSSGTKLSVSDIQGNWIANSATFSADVFTDFIAEGATITLAIQSNGRFTFTMMMPGQPDEVSTGKLGFDGEYLAVRFDGEDEEGSFFISLINDILTLRGQTELDLDGNGVDEFGILELIMERN
jgi:hypothetical protein